MIYNPFLERLLAVVGVQELSLQDEREMLEILKDYHYNRVDKDCASWEDGDREGYSDAELEHCDDWDDGSAEGEENVWNFLARRAKKEIEKCGTESEENSNDKTFSQKVYEWLTDAKLDY